ncbi:MAG: hypothetical protein SP1CHLAM54_04480 [Chlamydiia bacterium]|nr:hypothetical protein [Chlamydiia bacterium]MCH9615360.1 hypothetical protein [Chlamydiia bacterium]MCH9628318.1 hypothetical protein [Chlamydiia bacterium]
MMDSQKKAEKIGSFSALKQELKKISWTSKEELVTCVKIVLGAMFILGLGIYAVDLSLRGILEGIGRVLQWIGL